MLEGIALRHQIAVQWRDSLIIVQPETVLRWRREGFPTGLPAGIHGISYRLSTAALALG